MSNSVLTFLGLARRAGYVQIGEDSVRDSCRNGKAKLVLLAEDASDNARDRAEKASAMYDGMLVALPFAKSDIAAALGTVGCSMVAVTDGGFAFEILKKLSDAYPGRYQIALAAIENKKTAKRQVKNMRRKQGGSL